jgi:hypothetical protein
VRHWQKAHLAFLRATLAFLRATLVFGQKARSWFFVDLLLVQNIY